MEWDFDTQSNDIRWGLFFQATEKQNSEEEVIIPYGRYQSQFRPVNGKFLLNQNQIKGRYIMRWDNRYSKFYSKRLRYQVFFFSFLFYKTNK